MKKLLHVFGFLSMFSIHLIGQNNIDSLLKVVKKSPETEKVKALLQLSSIYLGINLDTSLNYASQVLKISKKIDSLNNQLTIIQLEVNGLKEQLQSPGADVSFLTKKLENLLKI